MSSTFWYLFIRGCFYLKILFFLLVLKSLAKTSHFHSDLLPALLICFMKFHAINDITHQTCALLMLIAWINIFLLGHVFYCKMLFFPLALRSLVKISYFHSNLSPEQHIFFMNYNMNDDSCKTCALITWVTHVNICLLGDVFWLENFIFPTSVEKC